MIDYLPLWRTLEKSDENLYILTNKHYLSHSTLHFLKQSQDISMKIMNELCWILDCQIQNIAEYVQSDDDQKL